LLGEKNYPYERTTGEATWQNQGKKEVRKKRKKGDVGLVQKGETQKKRQKRAMG